MDAKSEFQMNRLENRIKSFRDWPFGDDTSCTSVRMAEAGFFHIPTETEPDLVKCFVCLKALDGWEPEDIPRCEHKRHMPKCPFIILKKDEENWKVEDLIKLEVQRQRNIVKNHLEQQIENFTLEAARVRKILEEL